MTYLLAVIPAEFTHSETQRETKSVFLWGATDSLSSLLPPQRRKHRKMGVLNWSGRLLLEMTAYLGITGKSCQLP